MNKFLTIIFSISPTCLPLALSSIIDIRCLSFFVNINCLALWIHMFLTIYEFPIHDFQSLYIVLDHIHLNLSKGQELSTLPCLHPGAQLERGDFEKCDTYLSNLLLFQSLSHPTLTSASTLLTTIR